MHQKTIDKMNEALQANDHGQTLFVSIKSNSIFIKAVAKVNIYLTSIEELEGFIDDNFSPGLALGTVNSFVRIYRRAVHNVQPKKCVNVLKLLKLNTEILNGIPNFISAKCIMI